MLAALSARSLAAPAAWRRVACATGARLFPASALTRVTRGIATAPKPAIVPVPLSAHGGSLLELVASGARLASLRADAVALPVVKLNARHLCDLDLLLSGAFSPLNGFMGREDYERVVREMRLASGVLFPLPITLDVGEAVAKKLHRGDRCVLQVRAAMFAASRARNAMAVACGGGGSRPRCAACATAPQRHRHARGAASDCLRVCASCVCSCVVGGFVAIAPQ